MQKQFCSMAFHPEPLRSNFDQWIFPKNKKGRLSRSALLQTSAANTRTRVFILALRFLLKKISLRRTVFQTMKKKIGYCR
jgi:hypothetical protein